MISVKQLHPVFFGEITGIGVFHGRKLDRDGNVMAPWHTDASSRAVPGACSMFYVASHASHVLGMPMAAGRPEYGPTRQRRPNPSLRKSALRTPESQ